MVWKADFEKEIYNVSDFELGKIHQVRFWFRNFTTRQILDWKKYIALDFEMKIFRLVRFLETVCTQKSRFDSFYYVKITYLIFLCVFKSLILKWKFHYMSDFELKKMQSVRFLNKIFFRTRSILNWKFYKTSDFEQKF